jgi:hypothetical protein
MSVTRTTIEETMRKLEAGDWEAVGAIDQYGMVVVRNLRTGSRSTICIIDYQQVPDGKPPRAKK